MQDGIVSQERRAKLNVQRLNDKIHTLTQQNKELLAEVRHFESIHVAATTRDVTAGHDDDTHARDVTRSPDAGGRSRRPPSLPLSTGTPSSLFPHPDGGSTMGDDTESDTDGGADVAPPAETHTGTAAMDAVFYAWRAAKVAFSLPAYFLCVQCKSFNGLHSKRPFVQMNTTVYGWGLHPHKGLSDGVSHFLWYFPR